MRPTTQRLFSVAVLIFIASLVGLILALIFQWPAQLGGGSGKRDRHGGELVAKGTVTSLPLYPWIALTVFALLARSRRWWGTIAVVVLCLLGRSSSSEGWERHSLRTRPTFPGRCSSRPAWCTAGWAWLWSCRASRI